MNSETPNVADYYKSLLLKHGVCSECGEIYSHHITEPFASCSCATSEWHELTPYQELEHKIYKLEERLKAK